MANWNEVREALGEGPSPERVQQQRARLMVEKPPRFVVWRSWIPASVFAVAAVILLVLWPRSLVKDMGGAAVEEGAVVLPQAQVIRWTFNDDSVVTFAPRSGALLKTVDSEGVTIVLDDGELEAHVTHGTGRVWNYRAGPYNVRVVGTTLGVKWNNETRDATVWVTEGVVEVTGPNFTKRIFEGERWSNAAPAAEVTAVPDQLKGDPTPPAPSNADQRRAVAQPNGATPPIENGKTPPMPRAEVPSDRWRALLNADEHAKALEAAIEEGVISQPEVATTAELIALANAARLQGRSPLTRSLLQSANARGDVAAAEAAFLLGRIEAPHDGAKAADLFERAVKLDPDGALAEDARGRLVEIAARIKDRVRAERAAHEYLERHPAGPWSELARSTLGTSDRQ